MDVAVTPGGAPPRTARGRWLVLGALATTLFMISLDASVLNVALPAISEDLQPSATGLLWILDSYSLTVAALLTTMAALGDRVGRRRMLRSGLVVFVVASVLAATSDTTTALVVARVLLGVAAAMAMPATLSILRAVFTDERERGVAVGVWAAVGALGFVVGPLVGGAVLEVADWHWLFWMQIPVLLAALGLTWRVPESAAGHAVGIDVAGVVLSGLGIVSVVAAIKRLGDQGWTDPTAWLIGAAGLVALAVFVVLQLRRQRPMIDVRLFRRPRFAAAAVAVTVGNLVLAGPLLLLTQHLQLARGLSPLEAGLWLLPVALAAVAAGPATPRLVERVGVAGAVAAGFVVTGAGLAGFALVDERSAFALFTAAGILLGAGVSVVSAAASAALLSSAPVERAGNAAAIQETGYELGITLGISVFGALSLAVYRDALELPPATAPGVGAAAGEGLPQAVVAAAGDPGVVGASVEAFGAAFAATNAVAAAGTAVLAVGAFLLFRRR
jgi:DHA2 family multidrug resistance protein-like MFS transporter